MGVCSELRDCDGTLRAACASGQCRAKSASAFELVGDEAARRLVGDRAGRRVDLLVDSAAIMISGLFSTRPSRIDKQITQVKLRAQTSPEARRGALKCDRLRRERLLRHARNPVDRVLEHPRDRSGCIPASTMMTPSAVRIASPVAVATGGNALAPGRRRYRAGIRRLTAAPKSSRPRARAKEAARAIAALNEPPAQAADHHDETQGLCLRHWASPRIRRKDARPAGRTSWACAPRLLWSIARFRDKRDWRRPPCRPICFPSVAAPRW